MCFIFSAQVLMPFFFLATETAQQLKKTAGVPFHAKGRGLVKKIDTTSMAHFHQFSERKPDKVALMKNKITICFL